MRTGNNYSGPRFLFADERKSQPSKPGESLTLSGSSSEQRPRPYTVRRHYNRTFGVATYTVQIQGVRDHAGLPEFYDRDEAQRYADQRNRIEGRS